MRALYGCIYEDLLPGDDRLEMDSALQEEVGKVFGMTHPDFDTKSAVLGHWQDVVRFKPFTFSDIVAAVHAHRVQELFLRSVSMLGKRQRLYAQTLIRGGLHKIQFSAPSMKATASTADEACEDLIFEINDVLDQLQLHRERMTPFTVDTKGLVQRARELGIKLKALKPYLDTSHRKKVRKRLHAIEEDIDFFLSGKTLGDLIVGIPLEF